MKRAVALLVALLALSASLAAAASINGVVVAVDKKTFTIKSETGNKETYSYDPDMGKKAKVDDNILPNAPLGATPEQLKVGMLVQIDCVCKKSVWICQRALILEERLGKREIDFSPMLADEKDRLSKYEIDMTLHSKCNSARFRPYYLLYSFERKEGFSAKDVRNICKGQLAHDKWKVEAVGEAKLLIESRRMDDKDEPLNSVEIEIKNLPKDRQPRVRLVNPRDPTK